MAQRRGPRHDRPRRRHQRGFGRVHQVRRRVAADRGQPRSDRGAALARAGASPSSRISRESGAGFTTKRRSRRFTSTCASACARPAASSPACTTARIFRKTAATAASRGPECFARSSASSAYPSSARRTSAIASATSKRRRPSVRGRCSCAPGRALRPKRCSARARVPVFDDLAAAARSLLAETR